MTNVIAFPNPKAVARSRDRKEALGVIIPRLKALMAQGCTEFGGLGLRFHSGFDGGEAVYFRVHVGPKILMTGHLNVAGKYCIIDGQTVIVANEYIADVAIMSWKRGEWEARLFG